MEPPVGPVDGRPDIPDCLVVTSDPQALDPDEAMAPRSCPTELAGLAPSAETRANSRHPIPHPCDRAPLGCSEGAGSPGGEASQVHLYCAAVRQERKIKDTAVPSQSQTGPWKRLPSVDSVLAAQVGTWGLKGGPDGSPSHP